MIWSRIHGSSTCNSGNTNTNTYQGNYIIIFSRGEVRRFTTFKYGCDIIEVVSDYVYLVVKMNFNNTFANAMKKQLGQGRRAQFSVLIKARNLNLPIDIQTNVFESIVCSILLYGSEVWGFQKIDMLEICPFKLVNIFQFQYLKVITCTTLYDNVIHS